MSLRFALDYDATYTADPELWDNFIDMVRASGHDIVLITYRDEDLDWTEQMTYLEEVKELPIYCTGGVAKKWWASHFGPGKIDIWLDDNPKSILENSSFEPDALAVWRENDLGGERPAK